jgi:hypothetical protein
MRVQGIYSGSFQGLGELDAIRPQGVILARDHESRRQSAKLGVQDVKSGFAACSPAERSTPGMTLLSQSRALKVASVKG